MDVLCHFSLATFKTLEYILTTSSTPLLRHTCTMYVLYQIFKNLIYQKIILLSARLLSKLMTIGKNYNF